MNRILNRSSIVVTYCFLLVAWLSGCAELSSIYTPKAYENALLLKSETLALMDKANEPYASHQKEVEALTVKLDDAYQYSKGLDNNEQSAEQWQLLQDPEGKLVGKFFKKWQTADEGKLSKVIINEFKSLIADAFNTVICLETNKQKPQAREEKRGE